MTGHEFFGFNSFPGPAGADITAIAPSANDAGGASGATVNSGSAKADGSGNLVTAPAGTTTVVVFNDPSPASGEFDATGTLNLGNNFGAGLIVEAGGPNGQYYVLLDFNVGLTIIKSTGSTGWTNQNSSQRVFTSPATIGFSKRMTPNGQATLTATCQGASVTGTDTNPNPGGVACAAGLLDSSGGSTYLALAASNPPATAATLAATGSTSAQAGSEGAPLKVTLDHPAGPGGQVVNFASSGSGDTFHRVAGGAAVTSATIPDGGTTATFLPVLAAAGTSNLSITSPGLTIAGSPVPYTATAAPQTTTTATGYTLAVSAASIQVGTADTITAAITPAGSTLASALTIALADAANGSTIAGPITIPVGSTTGMAAITPGAAGAHAISGTHTGGGFTGGDGSTSFTATAAVVPPAAATGNAWTFVTGFAAGLGARPGFTLHAADGSITPARSTAGVAELPGVPGCYAAPITLGTVGLIAVWDDGGSPAIVAQVPQVFDPVASTATGLTADQVASLVSQTLIAAGLTVAPTPAELATLGAGLGIVPAAVIRQAAADGATFAPTAGLTPEPGSPAAALVTVATAATGAQTAATGAQAAATAATAAATAAATTAAQAVTQATAAASNALAAKTAAAAATQAAAAAGVPASLAATLDGLATDVATVKGQILASAAVTGVVQASPPPTPGRFTVQVDNTAIGTNAYTKMFAYFSSPPIRGASRRILAATAFNGLVDLIVDTSPPLPAAPLVGESVSFD